MLMPNPPHEPKTLFAARQTIASLKAQLAGHGKPIPKPPLDSPTSGKPVAKPPPHPPPNPDPSRPGMPGTNSLVDLSKLPPSTFADVLARCENRTLKHLLSLETAKP